MLGATKHMLSETEIKNNLVTLLVEILVKLQKRTYCTIMTYHDQSSQFLYQS